ncbi:MAG: GGDEF domain-containing protein [Pseudomonadota bacterium]
MSGRAILLGFDRRRATRAGLVFTAILVTALALSAVFSMWMVQFGLPEDTRAYILASMQITALVACPLALFAAQYSYTLERYEETLDAFASTDSLTGLLNQRYFEYAAEDELLRMKQNGHQGAVAVFELVDFPAFKDKYDKAAGDVVLRVVAGIAFSELRGPFDKLARRGSASFLILLSNATLVEAIEACERLAQRISDARFHVAGKKLDIPTCFGVAHLVSGDNVLDTIDAADEAMENARKTGSNRVFSSIGRSERVRLALSKKQSMKPAPTG